MYVLFNTATRAKFCKWTGTDAVNYYGDFTYDGQNGTIAMENDDDAVFTTATFSISGSTMTLNLLVR